jgi:hypothetical protein
MVHCGLMNTDRLVDFVCVRATHQAEPANPVVSMHGGVFMLCPRGETLGHVWRASAGAPFVDDRRIARATVTRGRAAPVPLRTN